MEVVPWLASSRSPWTRLTARRARCWMSYVDRLRTHGYRDEQIAEVAWLVALQLLTGAFNLIADIDATPEALAEINAEAER